MGAAPSAIEAHAASIISLSQPFVCALRHITAGASSMSLPSSVYTAWHQSSGSGPHVLGLQPEKEESNPSCSAGAPPLPWVGSLALTSEARRR